MGAIIKDGRYLAFLVSKQSETRAFRLMSFLIVLHHVLGPFDCSPSHRAQLLGSLNFSSKFSTNSPAAFLCFIFFIWCCCIVLSGGGNSITFAEEILVYCILAAFENNSQICSNIFSCQSFVYFFSKLVRRLTELLVAHSILCLDIKSGFNDMKTQF